MVFFDNSPTHRSVRWALATVSAVLGLYAAGCSDSGTDPAAPPDTGVPTAGSPTGVTDSSFTARWSAISGATGYRLDLSTDSLFGSFHPGYNNRDAGIANSLTITGLTTGVRYFYRVRAVTAGGISANSNAVGVTVHAGTTQVSFSQDVHPLFVQHGCTGCHGGTSGLTVETVADLLRGGNHGPAIVPGDGAGSILVKKISLTPPFGARMPQGGPFLPDASIATIRTWIDQGALNN